MGSEVNAERKASPGYYRRSASRVLLREPEVCMECNKVFVSLYPLRSCGEHEGLDEI